MFLRPHSLHVSATTNFEKFKLDPESGRGRPHVSYFLKPCYIIVAMSDLGNAHVAMSNLRIDNRGHDFLLYNFQHN